MAKPNDGKYLTTIAWENDGVKLIDQTKLPESLEYIICKNHLDIADAIKKLAIRGAPAIGVAAAMGLALCANNSTCSNKVKMMEELELAYDVLLKTRPTAINLKWGLDRVFEEAKKYDEVDDIRKHVILQAIKMSHDDVTTNKLLGRFGSDLINDGEVVMTHCNAGALATVSYGTALGVIRSVMESGKKISVIATETRPVMQGSRLTAFELVHDGIDVSLIPDTAVGYLMANKMIDKVVVGADRILKSGHVFNKIGTYQVALLAKAHNIPFYVAAPLSTFDMHNNEEDIVIEERSVDEVVRIGEKRIAPTGVRIFNPAFDVTSPELIAGIITEKGVIYPPFESNLKPLFESTNNKV
ncbi:Methylthioribose-1-phosphate isomerase [Candidatus Nitrosocosmicus oleophilus]|jgi:methylthioribose-1-phosphate isomerase|uniref:Putative methylthioribose-1-phosphate isomerase n=1 Tax=Candidatus Nitrosocosmicus oleophilus TaxID=1353260 RepID=A0A654LXE1_9ARCH|nr:S-methyl-5-thioribose-1-phosphate isomerase [Candidatus Nitrosocosmicus oleophilus]ALI36164.1 Methylthioribose-1-phosphate isomerase [Candidatus Nitrosocosmicus oleophilus]